MTDTAGLEAVRAVFERHKTDIMNTYQAEGVSIGKQDLSDDTYVIVVYLESEHLRPTAPASVEGVPLKFVVTGQFTTQL